MCPGVTPTDVAAIAGCLRRSVSDFWSAELNQAVDQPVVLDPTEAQVPTACRSAIAAAPAFTCQINDTVYINQSLISMISGQFGRSEVPYAVAAVIAHEIGHVVQAAVQQPGYGQTGSSDALSRQIEQQADCLSGVWAHQEDAAHRLSGAEFLRVAKALITDVSSNPEIATHGTPDERAAAISTGLNSGRPQACSLATFS